MIFVIVGHMLYRLYTADVCPLLAHRDPATNYYATSVRRRRRLLRVKCVWQLVSFHLGWPLIDFC